MEARRGALRELDGWGHELRVGRAAKRYRLDALVSPPSLGLKSSPILSKAQYIPILESRWDLLQVSSVSTCLAMML